MSKIYSLLPRLISYAGHIYPYHLALQEGFNQIGWDYFCLYPRQALIEAPNENWQPCLAKDLREGSRGRFSKIFLFFANLSPFRRVMKRMHREKGAILFIEQFDFSHLASLLVALFLVKPRFHFWILHRYSLKENSWKAKLYRWMHRIIQKRVGEDFFRCLTDSELLKDDLEKVLCMGFHVIPIPSFIGNRLPKVKKRGLSIWLPGDAMRADKGLSTVKKLMKRNIFPAEMKWFLSESAKLFIRGSKHLQFLPDYLSEEAYKEQMGSMDWVLLPYDAFEYRLRTSGVFVEAVCSGAIPIVTKGTWMAYELEKFALEDLIFNWEEGDFVEKLFSSFSDKNQAALFTMRDCYLNYHNKKNIVETLRNLQTERGKI